MDLSGVGAEVQAEVIVTPVSMFLMPQLCSLPGIRHGMRCPRWGPVWVGGVEGGMQKMQCLESPSLAGETECHTHISAK